MKCSPSTIRVSNLLSNLEVDGQIPSADEGRVGGVLPKLLYGLDVAQLLLEVVQPGHGRREVRVKPLRVSGGKDERQVFVELFDHFQPEGLHQEVEVSKNSRLKLSQLNLKKSYRGK